MIAGEPSGDLHGSNLMKELRNIDPDFQCRFWGGDLMKQVSPNIVTHIKEMSFMGFVEVIYNLRTISRFFKQCKADIIEYKPDVIIFIDYPGFNLRMAEWAKKQGFKTVFYISPQLWAWKKGRINKIKKYIDLMIPILPFEEEFYENHGVGAKYLGHPLVDAIDQFRPDSNFEEKNNIKKPVLALLPGSRKQEISKMLPVMLMAAEHFKEEYEIVVAATSNVSADIYAQAKSKNTKIILDKTYDILTIADMACVTSGTATLETALFEVPEVVCYKGSKISFEIGKRLVDIKYISLVNLIMDREVVKELIQDEFTSSNLRTELQKLIEGKALEQKKQFTLLKEKLGEGGASKRVAEVILKRFWQ